MSARYIKSPLNYMGGKFKILPTIVPIIESRKIDTFYDVFAGGFNVGININCKRSVCNDQIPYLINLFDLLTNNSFNEFKASVENLITKYALSKTNAEGYNALRDQYNHTGDLTELFVLTCYSFNHQIRFNSKHKFNTPFGKDRSSYNSNIEKNLKAFMEALSAKKPTFTNLDFRDIDYSKLSSNDFAYFDPPYLISTGTYNDGKRGFNDWHESDERDLLTLLDNLDSQNVPFALSNAMHNKGLSNDLLIDWAGKYNVHFIDNTFTNCSYHYKDRTSKTVEVLITNF